MLVAFVVLRAIDVYGDAPWVRTGDALRTTMSFLALTKYPPSLLFLLPTLGLGAILLALFEPPGRTIAPAIMPRGIGQSNHWSGGGFTPR